MSQIVPLTNAPNQSFILELTVDGKPLSMRAALNFNEMAGYWVLNLSNLSGQLVLASLPLVTGVWPASNILAQYAYLGIGSAYIVNAAHIAADDYPNASELGTDFVLIWDDTPSA